LQLIVRSPTASSASTLLSALQRRPADSASTLHDASILSGSAEVAYWAALPERVRNAARNTAAQEAGLVALRRTRRRNKVQRRRERRKVAGRLAAPAQSDAARTDAETPRQDEEMRPSADEEAVQDGAAPPDDGSEPMQT